MNELSHIGQVSLHERLTEEGKKRPGSTFREGIGVIKDTTNIPEHNWINRYIPFRNKDYRLLWVKSGSCRFNVNLFDLPLRDGDVLFVTPGSLIEQSHEQQWFNGSILSLSPDLSLGLTLQEGFAVMHPDFETLQFIERMLELIGETSRSSHASKETIANLALSLINFLRPQDAAPASLVPKGKSASKRLNNQIGQFVNLLYHHGLSEHRIGYYAKAMKLTPNYLNNIIKSASGQTINDWVNSYLFREAQWRLAHSTQRIAQLSSELGFTNQAFFARFFKNRAGLSPTAYRNLK